MCLPTTATSQIDEVRRLVNTRLGLYLRNQDLLRLEDRIAEEQEQLDQNYGGLYSALLATTHFDDPIWQRLVNTLVNKESHFFRDHDQYKLLRQKILPELIERRSPEKQLTIWSAGCSTGEEAYSVAILLKELIPDIDDWQITIIGTDISLASLAIAEQGTYTDWSFRSLDQDIRDRYFTQEDGQYQINQDIQDLVQFYPLNLRESMLPWAIASVDLILCRHVFIHLNEQAITHVLEQLQISLHSEGYLVTGHGELYGLPFPNYFNTCISNGSVLYTIPTREDLNPLPAFPYLDGRSPHLSKVQLYLSDPIFVANQ